MDEDDQNQDDGKYYQKHDDQYYKYAAQDSSSSSGWANSEEGIDLYFVIFLSLLAIALTCSKFLHDSPRVAAILPEAGLIIMIGAIAGFLLYFVFTPNASSGDAEDIDDDAENDHINEFVAEGLLSFSPKVFFFVLLPPIIFNSGYTLKGEVFFRHIASISLFACVGTAISTFAIAIILEVLKVFGMFGDFYPSFTELLTFGALISATDPVSTLAVFQAKKVDPQLFYLVFGESVLNDAVGLVLFKTTSKLVGNEDSIERVIDVVFDFLVDFSFGFIGSMIMGYAAGLVSAMFLKKVDMRHTPLLELSLFFLVMYLPFFVAELFELSGIVTILFTGISARRYATHNLSEATEETVDQLFRLVAHLAETAIFLELGLCVVMRVQKLRSHWKFAAFAMGACLVGRALNIYPLRTLYNLFLQRKENESHVNDAFNINTLDPDGSDSSASDIYTTHSTVSQATSTPMVRKDLKIRNNTAHMLWFSGLRGAVAYACAKTFPNDFGNRSVFVFATMSIVLFTVFVFGCSTELALNTFQIEMKVDEEKYMEENQTMHKMDYINVFEKKYIYPIVIRDYNGSLSNNIELDNFSVVGRDDDSWTQSTTVGVRSQYRGKSLDEVTVGSPHPRRRTRKKMTSRSSLYDYGHTIYRRKQPFIVEIKDSFGTFPEVIITGRLDMTFPYMPTQLHYIILELLKNAMRATCEHHGIDPRKWPPIEVVIADGHANEDVVIKISDEGGGIPRSNRKKIWSYLFTTADPAIQDGLIGFDEKTRGDHSFDAPLAGLGYGLPISRSYARYFGGDVSIESMEGYGSDAFVHLRRLGESMEPLPV